MAWMWWLLAPVASTVFGACALWWFGRPDRGRNTDAMREHRALLDALPQPRPGDPVPVTMQLQTPG